MKTRNDVALLLMLRRNWSDESGTGSVMGLFLFFVMLLLGSVAIDYSNGVRTKAQLQVVADSAALAAASQLSKGPEAVRKAAMDHAAKFGPNLVTEEDVVVGTWKDGQFTSFGQEDVNAVAIHAQRAGKNANPVPTKLLFLVGIDRMDVSAPSIVARMRGRTACSGGGYFAQGRVVANSSNDYKEGFCLHGEHSVNLHNVNLFEPGTIVSSPDVNNIIGHRNNHGLTEAKRSATHSFARSQELRDYLDLIRAEGVYSEALPPYIVSGPIRLNRITPSDTLQRGMLYFVNGDVTLRGDRLFREVAIIATGDISVQSNAELRDVILAANGSISVQSNVRIGGSETDYCLRDIYSSYLLALGNMSFGSNNQLRGIFMASQGNISLNSNNAATEGVYAEALGDITYNSASDKRGCFRGYDSELIYADWVTSMVR